MGGDREKTPSERPSDVGSNSSQDSSPRWRQADGEEGGDRVAGAGGRFRVRGGGAGF